MIVTLDFECYPTASNWISVAVICIDKNGNTISSLLEYAKVPKNTTIDPVNIKFWEKNPNALKSNLPTHNHTKKQSELRLCNFFTTLRSECPHFFLVCDNISFDILLLNNILKKHKFPSINIRGNGIYHQPLCVWTLKWQLQNIFGSQKFKDLQSTRSTPLVSQMLTDSANSGVKHTPVSDCYAILASYFLLLEVQKNLKVRSLT